MATTVVFGLLGNEIWLLALVILTVTVPILLVDSWSGYQRAKVQYGGAIQFETIPKKTTRQVQPLDVYFNRQFKSFYRRLTEILLRERPDFVVSQRASIARLLNITIKQFSAPRFELMLKYAWFAAGLLEERPPRFEVSEQFCFLSYHRRNLRLRRTSNGAMR
ncbi:hypothetical protein L596_006433 [Steinernema carpocapsae]|uniref:Uncharacterized protein n=1 Tax=Steinernema carpocapsae TaxID=34508 RepID=A0A4U8V214_STECR|nr:hypothetical protein L596_006433 [Steinernema carpocapsae]